MNIILLMLSIVGFAFARSIISKILFTLYILSVVSGILIADELPFDGKSLIYVLYIHTIISILFYSFNGLKPINIGKYNFTATELRVLKAVIYFSIIGVLANSHLLANMMSHFASANIVVEVFKNGGVGLDFYKDLNPLPRSLSAFFSPLSYLCLPMHFYFLMHGQSRLSSLAFIGSLSIIIEQLAFFGRGGIVTFLMIYLIMFIYIYPALLDALKRRTLIYGFIFIIIVMSAFIMISLDRFTDFSHFEFQGSINNSVIFSILSYYSQWITNGYRIYLNFNSEMLIFFSNFMYIPNKIINIIGHLPFDIQASREFAFGMQATYFNGLPALMLYDMHYYGSYLFVILYFLFVRYLLRQKKLGKRMIYQFIILGISLPFPVMFFQGIHFVHGGYNLAIVYFLILLILRKVTISRKVTERSSSSTMCIAENNSDIVKYQ